MSSEKNLATAFAGESQANRKYLAFADKAEQEGYPTVAKLFRATAAAEAIHALSELKAMGGIKSTAENLKMAIEGEEYEFTEMYPEFIKVAEAEGNNQAKRIFHFAKEAEKVHAALYGKILAALENKDDMDFYLCPICGYIHEDEAPEKCPICGAKGTVFKNIQ